MDGWNLEVCVYSGYEIVKRNFEVSAAVCFFMQGSPEW
jgi:hypothetical protein